MRFRSWLPILVAYLCICGITATKDPDPDDGNGNNIRWKNPIVDKGTVGLSPESVPNGSIKSPPKRNDSIRENSRDEKGNFFLKS